MDDVVDPDVSIPLFDVFDQASVSGAEDDFLGVADEILDFLRSRRPAATHRQQEVGAVAHVVFPPGMTAAAMRAALPRGVELGEEASSVPCVWSVRCERAGEGGDSSFFWVPPSGRVLDVVDLRGQIERAARRLGTRTPEAWQRLDPAALAAARAELKARAAQCSDPVCRQLATLCLQ